MFKSGDILSLSSDFVFDELGRKHFIKGASCEVVSGEEKFPIKYHNFCLFLEKNCYSAEEVEEIKNMFVWVLWKEKKGAEDGVYLKERFEFGEIIFDVNKSKKNN